MNKFTTDDLRQMKNKEGLIKQACAYLMSAARDEQIRSPHPRQNPFEKFVFTNSKEYLKNTPVIPETVMDQLEAHIIQGCGGDLNEWVDGINKTLTDAGILKDGTKFKNISVFEHDGLTNLLLPFEDAKIDVGKLAMWRLLTHDTFGGTWLSDYVPNRLGGFVQLGFEEQIEKLYDANTYTSPDFQCDQTDGYPTSLCVNWEQGKAWLALNYSIAKSGEDLSAYEQRCAQFGIRDCQEEETFNGILRSLGVDVLENVDLLMEDEDQAMQL